MVDMFSSVAQAMVDKPGVCFRRLMKLQMLDVILHVIYITCR
jgi:hypothetical protein